jgi:hypothetical protein
VLERQDCEACFFAASGGFSMELFGVCAAWATETRDRLLMKPGLARATALRARNYRGAWVQLHHGG